MQASKNHVEIADSENDEEKRGEEEITDEISDEITDASFQPISDSEMDEVISAIPSSSTSQEVKPKPLSLKYLRHLRLVHASTSVISKISRIKSTFDSSSCVSCIRAKQHQRPFPKSIFKATQKL